jgi:RecA/RadA recombinase
MLRRICHQCCPKPVNSQVLLNQTTGDLDALLLQASAPVVAPHERPQSDRLLPHPPSSDDPPPPIHVSCSVMGDRFRYLPTGLPKLDRGSGGSGGGIRLRSVTEVVGRAGAGKTQFALQLVLMAAKYNQGCMYIDTEKKLILERLRDMATVTATARGNDDMFSFKTAETVLQNMTVKQPHSTAELVSVLDAAEEEILLRNQQHHLHQTSSSSSSSTRSGGRPLTTFPVRLLIVDSIAAPLKRDFGPQSIPQRAATAFSIAQTLKRLAEQLHLAVIVINQVGIAAGGGGSNDADNYHYRRQQQQQPDTHHHHHQVAVRASLGMSWHHCVSTRILLDHDVDPHRDAGHLVLAGGNDVSHSSNRTSSVGKSNSHGSQHRRSLSVVKSNWMPCLDCSFTITPVGIVECPPPVV